MEKTITLKRPIKQQSIQRGGFIIGLACTTTVAVMAARELWLRCRAEIARQYLTEALAGQEYRIGSRAERKSPDEMTIEQLRMALGLQSGELRSCRETLQTISEMAK